ncbi:transcriptional regulator BetI [Roseovarius salis]|uniref:transcriptional regulator BetI n=1 Tax=Roseovarius salis TaxID=3376063 RepID=UPI0037C558E2
MPDPSARAAKTGQNTGRTASKEVRRQQLIDATIESIAQNGMSGTTMTSVTGFAGLSIGIVNFHFKNKETLFEETLRYLAEEHRNQWRQSVKKADLAPEAKLLAIVDAHFHPRICSRKKLAVWFGFYGEAATRASYRHIMSEIDDERWYISQQIIGEIIEAGGHKGLTAREVADTLEGLYDGFWLNILIYPEEFSRDDAMARIRDYLADTFPNHFDHPAPRLCED